jgi:DNA/RNA-binding domain of Phe-tRNA-synthetase-like protein
METITQAPHPLLRAAAFRTTFPRPLGEVTTPADWSALLSSGAEGMPLQREEAVRGAVRDLLRCGGYKPTGRGKPASEYLVRAADEGVLRAINAAVDACNIVSLHSGLPISVVDLDRCRFPLSIRVAAAGERYVFNPAGQEIELAGLPCLCDAAGPCGNAVKDAQRTKTDEVTERTLSVVWGVTGHEARLERAVTWYRELLHTLGAETEVVRTG